MAERGDVTLKIPRPLYEKLQVVIADTGFHSVTEFVVYVLRDLVSTGAAISAEQTAQEPAQTSLADDNLTAEEIRIIRKRLQDLGYL